MEFVASVASLLRLCFFVARIFVKPTLPLYVHPVTRDYKLPVAAASHSRVTSSPRAACVACSREIETTVAWEGNAGSHDPPEKNSTLVGRAVSSQPWRSALQPARRLMYKMVRKSNERKAASSDGSRGSSLPRGCDLSPLNRARRRSTYSCESRLLFIQTLPPTPVRKNWIVMDSTSLPHRSIVKTAEIYYYIR